MLRAAWFAQELLTTFNDSIGEVALSPGSGAIFQVRVNKSEGSQELIWDRKRDNGFPEIKDLKQKIRDLIGTMTIRSFRFLRQCSDSPVLTAPDMSLGHSDVKKAGGTCTGSLVSFSALTMVPMPKYLEPVHEKTEKEILDEANKECAVCPT